MISVTTADGEVREVPRGTPAVELLSKRESRKSVGVSVDGVAADLRRPLVTDCTVEALPPDCEAGIEILRHSTAHLLAHAVKRLFPEAEVTIGPVIDDGFYYDFRYDPGFTPEDLPRIEEEMTKIVGERHTVEREELPRADAIALFESMGESFKAEIVRDLPDDVVSLYRQGDFVDLCRGPHVPSAVVVPVAGGDPVARAVPLLDDAGAAANGSCAQEDKQDGRCAQDGDDDDDGVPCHRQVDVLRRARAPRASRPARSSRSTSTPRPHVS